MFVPESIIIAEGISTAVTRYLGGTTAMVADVATAVRDLIDESAAAAAAAAAAASEISSKTVDRTHSCACSLSKSYHTPVFCGPDIPAVSCCARRRLVASGLPVTTDASTSRY